MKAGLERSVVGIVSAIFIGSLFFSLFQLMMDMSLEGSMTDCPYMTHETVFCPMNLLDHITAWKVAFISIAPSIFVLGGLFLVAIVSIAPNLLYKIRLWLLRVPINRYRMHTESLIVRPLQELFSRGILHPKLF